MVLRERSGIRQRSTAPGAPLPFEAALFAIATGIGAVHAIDDAVFNRQPGVPSGQHGPAALITLAVACVAIRSFGAVRPGLRAGVAGTFGALALTNGAMHLIAVTRHGPSGSDATGSLAAIAGVALLLLAPTIAYLHRRPPGRSVRRTWLHRLAASATVLALAPVTVLPVGLAIVQTHMPREAVTERPSAAYRDVTFESADGLSLSGWYAASRNGAGIVLVNSSGGDRNGSIAHARMLAAHGYGVLLYDARGSGRSEGSPNAYGWDWDRDVAGALDFLTRQADVDPDRIGGLGLSTGADVLIAMAGGDRRLGAIVADGATGRSFADMPPGFSVDKPTIWVMFNAVRLLSGSRPGPALETLVADVSPTPLLLISAGSLPIERPMNAIYARAAREPVELWDLPDVHHTAAIREVPDQYRRRVLGHFDRALLA